jgi:hypothetical protein
MSPEFYLILRNRDIDDALADIVYEAGFDDSSLIMRGGHAAVWATQREGEVIELVREAIAQAARAGLDVLRVEITPESFAKAQSG